jgi:5-methylcytosine-specific restriction endonuclease McrA
MRADRRCDEHARILSRSRNAVYADPRWAPLRQQVLRAWIGEHGYWCPGIDGDDGHPAHPARDLTVDHVVPVSRGGAPYDRSNLGVLCGSGNSRKGNRTPGQAASGQRRAPQRAPGWGNPSRTGGVRLRTQPLLRTDPKFRVPLDGRPSTRRRQVVSVELR